MTITRLKLPLEQAEYTALLKMAVNELRNPVDQARFILRQELERRGLLGLEAQPGSCQNSFPYIEGAKQEGNNVTG